MILLFKMVPEHSVEVSSNVPRCKKAVTCLKEEICILEKLSAGMSYRSELAVSSVLMN